MYIEMVDETGQVSKEILKQTQEILVDLSSTIGFMRSNDTQTLNFEQLLNGFGDNIDFICDAIGEFTSINERIGVYGNYACERKIYVIW